MDTSTLKRLVCWKKKQQEKKQTKKQKQTLNKHDFVYFLFRKLLLLLLLLLLFIHLEPLRCPSACLPWIKDDADTEIPLQNSDRTLLSFYTALYLDLFVFSYIAVIHFLFTCDFYNFPVIFLAVAVMPTPYTRSMSCFVFKFDRLSVAHQVVKIDKEIAEVASSLIYKTNKHRKLVKQFDTVKIVCTIEDND